MVSSFGNLGLMRLLLRDASGYIALESFLRLSIIFHIPCIQVSTISELCAAHILLIPLVQLTRTFAKQHSWLLLSTLILTGHFRIYLAISKSVLEHKSFSPFAVLVEPILDLQSLLAHQAMALIQRHRRNALRPVRFLRCHILGTVRVQFEFALQLKPSL